MSRILLRDLAPHDFGLHRVDAWRTSRLSSSPAAPTAADRRARPIRSRMLELATRAASAHRFGRFGGQASKLVVIDLRALAGLEPVLAGLRGIAGQRQSFGGEIVVDLAIRRGVPQSRFADGGRLLARFVIAQQVTDFVNQQRGVLFDRMRRQPRFVVVETPVRSTAMLAIRSVLTGIRLKSAGAK